MLGLTVDAKFKQVRRAYWSLKSELSGGSQEATQARVAEIETAYRRLRQIHRDQTALLTPKTV